MKRAVRTAINCIGGFFAATAISGLAFAAGGHGESHADVYSMVALAVNVIILFSVVIYFAKGPLAKTLAEKRKEAEKALEETALIKEQAEKKLAEYTAKLARVEEEIKELEAEFKAQGERERERIVADAKKTAEKIIADAEATVAQEVKRAMVELTERTSREAFEIAARIIKENINDEDRKKLAEEYIKEVSEISLQ